MPLSIGNSIIKIYPSSQLLVSDWTEDYNSNHKAK